VKKELTTDLFGLAFKDFMDGDNDSILDVQTKLAGFTEQEELPVSYFFRTINEMPEWERLALDACQGSVLDAGAGAGAHALELQKRGHKVYAIDISYGAVEVMKRRGVEQVNCTSLLDLFGKKFDTLLFLMNGIGMAEKLDGLRRVFLHAKSLLVPGGSIILESTDIMYMYQEEDGSVLLPMGSKYYGEVNYQLSYRHHRGKTFPWLFVDSDNLFGIAEECGFVPEILYRGESDNYLARITLPG
jgi:SAM-dependent methyltransferase